LQRQLHNDAPELFVKLHVMAAQWYEARDDIELAIDHYLDADHIEHAVVLAERMAHAYFVQGKIETLLNWGTRLHNSGIPAPILLYTCARAHTDRYEYDTAASELEEAEKGFAVASDEARLLDVQLQRAMIDMQRGDYRQAVEQASRLLDCANETDSRRGRILRILGFARFSMGEIEIGIQQMEESVALHRDDGDIYALTNVLQDLQTAYTRIGRLDDVAACLQEIVALRRSLGGTSALALALNNLGCYYHLRGDYPQAMLVFQEGLSVAARAPNKRAESYLLWSLGDLQRDRNAYDEAIYLYDKALELIGGSEPLLRSSILISLSTLRRWQGRFSDAALLAEEALTLAGMYNMAQESVIAQAFVWAARAHFGQSSLAAKRLDLIVSELRAQNLQSALVPILGLRAGIALLHHSEDYANKLLSEALHTAQNVAGIQTLAAEVVHTPPLETLVMTNSAAYSSLVSDMKRLRHVQIRIANLQHATMRIVSRVTYSLNVLTLGQEQIELDGLRIPSSAWRATTAKEVFLYILFRGPVNREGLSAVFWPESNIKHVRGSFHTTLHRIRHALGSNIISLQDDLYRINPDVDVRCDANEMEALVLQARLLSPRDAGTEELWRKAVELYRGDFLVSLDSDWVFTRREMMREFYLEALIGLGECMRVRRDFKGALVRLKQAREVDPYREDIHRAIMTCYAEMGEKKQVLLHYQQLQDLLYQDLAIEPSAETTALADTLLR
jgi:DNA-binding SARP family transcriptional activator